ncbi:MAG TPA: ATP-dependent DNA helicase RecG [Solirubrobacteraceae bacterium]|jgi:ATP-dependent DNA helicase RecG
MSRAAVLKNPSPPDPACEPQAPREIFAFAGQTRLDREQMLAAPLHWPRPSKLEDELALPGGKVGEAIASLGIKTVGDLLEHLPRDSREARTIAMLRIGEQATVAVAVVSITARAVRRRGMRPLVEATVRDHSGSMRATFFNQPWLVGRYPPGTRLLLHGKADQGGRFSVSHHAIAAEIDGAPEAVAHYSATEGVTSTQILTLVHGVREALCDVCELLPAGLRVAQRLPDRASALAALHFPRDNDDTRAGRERLAFEELLLSQLAFLRRRARHQARSGALTLAQAPSRSARWLSEELPFELTDDQRTAIAAIDTDISQPRSMQRLLMGEVGSGKTVVALYAMLRAVENGHQAALMAPTETLAEQHFATLQKLITGEPIATALLTGSTPVRRRRDILAKLHSGELQLVVGTHALIEPTVEFRSLALAVVDEQHRFGVRQRAALDDKGSPWGEGESGDRRRRSPHILHMTATPIPRTLALASYGDLDVSTLCELPTGRQPIETCIVSSAEERKKAYAQLREQLSQGRQAYVVCPLIEQAAGQPPGDDPGELRAASAEFKRLAEGELEGYELVLLHGQMPLRERQQAMAQFAQGDAHVLVSTTVIEVGIDVANATVMLVESAERFGISQLHQLRGRIGRGEHASVCMLMGSSESGRLGALKRYSDGFRLAEIDLKLRKEGDLSGTRQSGVGQFKVACLPDDEDLLERARAQAQQIMAADETLSDPEHTLLGELLQERFGEFTLEPIPA